MGDTKALNKFIETLDENSAPGCSKLAFVYLSLDRLKDAERYLKKANETGFFHIDFLAEPLLKHHQKHPSIRPLLEQYSYGAYLR